MAGEHQEGFPRFAPTLTDACVRPLIGPERRGVALDEPRDAEGDTPTDSRWPVHVTQNSAVRVVGSDGASTVLRLLPRAQEV